MAGRRAKKAKLEKEKSEEETDPKTRAAKPLRFGKMEFYVGAKVEALENKHWYAAKIVKINEKDRKVLIHFEGWNQRYDCWLPIHSPKLKASTKIPSKEGDNSEGDREFSKGDHVLARWANGRHYPAEVLSCKGDGGYEVLFFDGFRKIVSKSNLRLDKKKMYKELDKTVNKEVAPTIVPKKASTTPINHGDPEVPGSSRHRKPVSMTDFVTPALRKNKRKSDPDESGSPAPAKSSGTDDTSLERNENCHSFGVGKQKEEVLAENGRPKRVVKKKVY